MKLTLKLMLNICMLMTLCAIFFQILQLHESTNKIIPTTLGTTGTCRLRFNDRTLLKKLIANMTQDGVKTAVQEELLRCQRLDKRLKLSLKPKIRTVPGENHFLVYSPRLFAEESSKTSSRLPLCPTESPFMQGPVAVEIAEKPTIKYLNGKFFNWPMTFEEISSMFSNVMLGGFYPGPRDCKCRSYNAIIVPYRDREEHLRYFLYYIHQLLQRQQICYVIIVAEQDDKNIFNKGQLMNAAFQYAQEVSSFDCYIFHDVDIIAEDDRVLYGCRDNLVTHLAPYIDKFKYKYMDVLTVGAAVGFTYQQFMRVNGYSNEFAGWGGEDDDMMARIKSKRLKIWRSVQNYTRFTMIKHNRDPGNLVNRERFLRLRLSRRRYRLDGVKSLDTEVVHTVFYKTHVRLKIKTYKTTMQEELEKMNRELQRRRKLNSLSNDTALPVGPGIPIQVPGRVIRIPPP